ncbi:MAG: FAD:protein FMN transferase, partial [Thermodesulfobacteriota bacterium]
SCWWAVEARPLTCHLRDKMKLIPSIVIFLAHPQVLVERAFFVMGTILEFRLYCNDKEVCDKAILEAYSEVKRLDDIFSNYKNNSVLSRVNSFAGDGRISVPPEFIELTSRAIFFSGLTDGAFDITVGKANEIWRVSEEKNLMPNHDEIESAQDCIGFGKLDLYPQEKQIELKSPCLSLDFGGIGKGYALDRAVKILRLHGIKRGIVKFGGNIYAMKPSPGEDGWDVGIRHPRDEDEVLTILKVEDLAVSTSGDYERYFEVNGRRFSHIIDPRDGLPVEFVPSVTVIANNGTDADALSTALSVMKPDKAIKFIECLKDVGVMIVREEKGKLSIYRNPSFSKLEVLKTIN